MEQHVNDVCEARVVAKAMHDKTGERFYVYKDDGEFVVTTEKRPRQPYILAWPIYPPRKKRPE